MKEFTLTDKILELFFVETPVEVVLKSDMGVSGSRFSAELLSELIRNCHQEYTDTESKLISQYYLNQRNELNVFQMMAEVAGELLIVKNNRVCCRYESILRWREVSRQLGEDVLVCAFLADEYQRSGKKCRNFKWDIVLGHSNKQLNAIMREGISDNHFHLFGSAPIFPMIWLRMMNNISYGRFMAGLVHTEKSRRHVQYDLGIVKGRFSPYAMLLQAALMRTLMYRALYQADDFQEVGGWFSLLECGDEILYGKNQVKDSIEELRLRTIYYSGELLEDYALYGEKEPEEFSNWLLAGERRLVYDMLCDILMRHRLPDRIQGLLYPYLLIRTWFRKEIVQVNDAIGFENFSIYSHRKNLYLPTNGIGKYMQKLVSNRESEKNMEWMVCHSVLESFQPDNLRSLEIRISPTDDFATNVKMIEMYDRLLQARKPDEKDVGMMREKVGSLSLNQFFYVLHFGKQQDKSSGKHFFSICRHWQLRKSLDKKAEAIKKMRMLRPEIARRVRGIDACAMEIGCRPEVFACVFRRLRMDAPSVWSAEMENYLMYGYYGENNQDEVAQLSATYHVGEDFLDPVDGLRALDEAVRFLELGYGDRMGHATVLGIDIRKWYEKKDRTVHLKAQDYLDNVAWFYIMLQEFQIKDVELLKDYLLRQFSDVFYEIYGAEREGYSDIAEDHFAEGHFNINTYYEAWKLRGDAPILYQDGVYKDSQSASVQEELIRKSSPGEKLMRHNNVVAYLYYLYHYDEAVKRNGSQVKVVRVPEIYIQGAILLQKSMQRKIAQKGIGIETNPSSNLAISTIDSYAEHPILNLYTMELGDGRDVPQMFVSVNTDDRGVFHTSLENEYALLAASVENLRDENGNKIYTTQAVYEWLNHIRVMGNQQVFTD